jgi:hypothetical protein
MPTEAAAAPTPADAGSTDDLARRLTEALNGVERDMSFANTSPRDAATLIIIDRSGAEPKVLLGCGSACNGQARVRRARLRSPPSARRSRKPD